MFYIGVVEDNSSDELKLGRLKVRIFGVHSDNRNEYPTEDLPWCMPVSPNIGNISEIGIFSVPERGSWVICGFLDKELQQPIYFGTTPRFETSIPDSSIGFSDPSGLLPNESNLNRTSVSKIATGEKNTPDNRPSPKAGGSIAAINEPSSDADQLYPWNKVLHSRFGHILEIDDSPGKERICVTHRSGSFIEFQNDGTIILHSANNKMYVVSDDTMNIYSESNTNIFSNGNTNVEATTLMNLKSGGIMTLQSGGNLVLQAGGGLVISAAAGASGTITGSMEINTTADFTVNTGGNINLN